jgi:hypothetical protein
MTGIGVIGEIDDFTLFYKADISSGLPFDIHDVD